MRIVAVLLACLATDNFVRAANVEWIQIADDGKSFVQRPSGRKFVPWGVNYDRDRKGRLLEDYWIDEWPTVEQDFREMKRLGANVVRIHLQFGKFMKSAADANEESLDQLQRLVKLADDLGLYLDLTGLACYRKRDVPAWFDQLDEPARWAAQAEFWRAVSKRCADQPAVFFYDLLNEPAAPKPGEKLDGWLFGNFFGKYYGQRIALESKQRTRQEVVGAWIDRMVLAVRSQDKKHLVTVGLLPPEFDSGFEPEQVAPHLDFLAVHIYPKADKPTEALETVRRFKTDKLLIVEELFPLASSADQALQFIEDSRPHVSGWFSFYWGETPEELAANETPGNKKQLEWLLKYMERGKTVTTAN